jgi:hypothetical protein
MNLPAERFIETYFSAYEAEGFTQVPGGNLYIQDGSTIFASCTVSNYRDALTGIADEPGSVMVQRCFRTRPLEDLHTDSRGDRRSLFDMYGGFDSSDTADITQKMAFHSQVLGRTLQKCGVDKDKVLFVADGNDLDRWNLPATDGYVRYVAYGESEVAPQRAGKAVKQYGDGVTGHGLEIFTRRDTWSLAGNIVETATSEGETTGIDFGGGLEAAVTSIHGTEAAYLDNELCRRFGIEPAGHMNPRLLNLLESLEAMMLILAFEPERHPLSSTNNAISFATRSALLQAGKLGMTQADLRQLGGSYHTADIEIPVSSDLPLALIAERQGSIRKVARAAFSGKLGKRLSTRSEQAARQGHTLSKTAQSRIIVAHLNELPLSLQGSIPPSLLAEELEIV